MTEDLIDECYQEVADLYARNGRDDRAAKGPKIVEQLRHKLEQLFIEPLRAPRGAPKAR